MRILIAPDKFKGSLGAAAVGARIAAGLRSALPEAELEIAPVADGGEGTAAAICAAREGEWREVATHDALGRPLRAPVCWLAPGKTAVFEMSAAAGLAQLTVAERDPLRASTFGVGEMLRAVSAAGAREIIVGLGGSATNDGGVGLARALGFRFRDASGRELTAAKLTLARIEPPNDLALPPILAATDVDNPLLGPRGATRIFGPQKGASPAALEILEAGLARLADVAAQTFGRDHRDAPGAGAAGGLGFGLLTFAAARLRSGFEVVADMIDLRARMERADFVITGEGRLDASTLSGKAPGGVARMAQALGKPVFAIVGAATPEMKGHAIFEAILTLDDPENTAALLELRAAELGQLIRRRKIPHTI